MKARIPACAMSAAMLCSCAGVPPPPAAEAASRIEARVDTPADKRASALVAYFAAVARSGAGEQKKELAQAFAALGREASPYTRLKLGGLYAQPAPGLRDDVRALALLEPLATANGATPADRPIADLALLLYAQVAERQRLAKDEARKQQALRERIEAMKSIERSIMQREERAHRK